MYKDDEESARIYLYEHFNVFLVHSWIKINDYPQRKMEDTISEMYLKVDERIRKSMKSWYAASQIYNYIARRRLRWELLNIECSISPMWYIDDWLTEIWFWYDFDMEEIDSSYKMSVIREKILELDESSQKILLLRYFSPEKFTWKQIAKASWVQSSAIWEREKKAINKLKDLIFWKATDEETSESEEG